MKISSSDLSNFPVSRRSRSAGDSRGGSAAGNRCAVDRLLANRRWISWVLAGLVFLCLVHWSSEAMAQWPNVSVDDSDKHAIERGPGGYFSVLKLFAIVSIFVVWIRIVDWVNIDSIEMQGETGLRPEVMNVVNIATFILGFLGVITVPFFFLGFPLYFLTAFLPFLVYVFLRNGRVPAEDKAFSGRWFADGWKNRFYTERNKRLASTEGGPDLDFKAAGETDEQRHSLLIKARQSPQFATVKQILFDGITKRAGMVLIDCAPESTAVRMEVDGFWHELASLDRVAGDQIAFALKSLGGLNVMDRASPQRSEFTVIRDTKKTPINLQSQGMSNGERITLTIPQDYASNLTPQQVGMWPEVAEATIQSMNSGGTVLISGPQASGLSTSWRSLLAASDRLTRDCVALVDPAERDTNMENIQRREIVQGTSGDLNELESLVLRNPEVLILPQMVVEPPAFVDRIATEVVNNDRTMIVQLRASSAAEAILRFLQKRADRKTAVQGLTIATCQRLVRRLCDHCKQPLQPNPQLIQQLGGKPGDVVNLCGPYLPPPTPPVDEKGQPVQVPTCQICAGLGYVGRIAVVEALEVDDELKQVLMKTNKVEQVSQYARKMGHQSLVQQAYRLVLAGITSLQEVQRVFQSKSS